VKGGSIAAYADGTFDVTSKWRLIAGARVTHETKSRNNGLWALWQNFSTAPDPLRFGTEGFQYAKENRTIFNLAPTSTVTDRVNAFLNGIQSFGARDTVPQYLCADPPTAAPGEAQLQRVIPNGTGGLKCSSGINPTLLAQDAAYQADNTQPRPFNIDIIPQNNSISNTFFDWRVGTEYDVSKENMLYATVTTAHKAGGFNDTIRDSMTQLPENPPLYKPESIISFEVGSKNMFLDRHLKFNASAFVYRYTDMVFQTIVTVTPDDPNQPGDQSSSIAVRQNAASATIYGLDADFIYSLPLGLEAEVHALAMDARFGDGTIVNDSRIGYDVPNYKVDIGGNWLPRASPISLNYTLSQFLPSSVGIFHWLVSAQTVAKHYMSVYNGHGNYLPQYPAGSPDPTTSSFTNLLLPGGSARLTDVVPTYTRFDIGAGWKHPDSRLSIDGYINNVGNIAYATTVISTPGLNLRFFNPPRTAGIRVRVDW
ncbi:MAG TPA: TonB-dependent receptor, partial [Polyangiaceae bacterium]|nr:TonB-dependent receptor [Polyangiaceae bacterium]